MRRRQFLAGLAASATTLAAPALALSPEHKRLLGAGANSPSLDLNFLNTGSLDGRITFTRASNATYFDTTGTLQTATTNVPRFDNDPATLASLGLLIEEQRTNGIRNPRAEGAVVGTPGTLPTNWSTANNNSITPSVVGTGTENGVSYIDLLFSGTALAGVTDISFDTNTGIAAATGQTWAASTYVRLTAGATTNIASMTHRYLENTGGGVPVLDDFSGPLTLPTGAALTTQRITSTMLLSGGGTVGAVRPGLRLTTIAGAVNFTLRIGAPQLELGAFVTSVILPPAGTPAAATRAADVATMPVGSWFNASAGSLAVECILTPVPATQNTELVGVGSNTLNLIRIILGSAGTVATAQTFNGGSNTLTISVANSFAANAVSKAAISYNAALGVAIAANGGAAVSGTSTGFPASMTTVWIGGGASRGGSANGPIRRVRYWPRALSSAELQQVTT